MGEGVKLIVFVRSPWNVLNLLDIHGNIYGELTVKTWFILSYV